MGLAHLTPAVLRDWPSPDLPVRGPGLPSSRRRVTW